MTEPPATENPKDPPASDMDQESNRESSSANVGSLIEPIYAQTEPDETIPIGTIPATFSGATAPPSPEALVCMRFTPRPQLQFEFSVVLGDLGEMFAFLGGTDRDEADLELTDRGVKVSVTCISKHMKNKGPVSVVATPNSSPVTVTEPSQALSKAVFHLFNFPEFYGPDDYRIEQVLDGKRTTKRCGKVVLKADGWIVTLAAFGATSHACTKLKKQGGHIVTHMGSIVREDASTFSSEQLEHVLHCVHAFLSVSLGRWAGVALPIGFDENGARAFEQWGMPKTASGPWIGALSWFDAHHGRLLSDLYAAFVARMNDEMWGPAIRQAIHWYVAANDDRSGMTLEMRLILAQTGLEYLAWFYCVQDRGMVSSDAFGQRGLSAANRIRLLVTSMDIPIGVPKSMRALHAQRGKKWLDGAEAITEIRNAIVHPSKELNLPDGAYCDAWRLSLWYLDLVFLRLLGHEGEYGNRLSKRSVGEVETVPWG